MAQANVIQNPVELPASALRGRPTAIAMPPSRRASSVEAAPIVAARRSSVDSLVDAPVTNGSGLLGRPRFSTVGYSSAKRFSFAADTPDNQWSDSTGSTTFNTAHLPPLGLRSRAGTGLSRCSVSSRRMSFDVPPTPDSHWCYGTAEASFFSQPTTGPTVPAAVPEASPPVQTLQLQGHLDLNSPQSNTQSQPMTASATHLQSATMSTQGISHAMPQFQAQKPLLPGQGECPVQQMPLQAAQGTVPMPMQMQMQMPMQMQGQQSGQMPMQMFFMPGPGGGFQQVAPTYTMVPGNPCMAAPQAAASAVPTPAQEVGNGKVSTLMLRNIPVTYDRDQLLTDLESRGFRLCMDFFYLPIDFQTGNNVGYAFVNLNSETEVDRFRKTYHGIQLSADRSNKICAVCDAQKQGLHQNVEHYRNSPVMGMEEKYQPMMFENGIRQPFPGPTRPLKQVRQRATRATGTTGQPVLA